MRRALDIIKNKRGMTLTEVMVGVAMIALVSTMMASGFLAASALIRRGADVGGAGSLAASYIEMQRLESDEDVSVEPIEGGASINSIKVNGVTISGKYYRYKRQSGGEAEAVEYIVFVPDGA